MNLEQLRKRIDEVDRELSALLGERMMLSEMVGQTKKDQSAPVRNIARENVVKDNAAGNVDPKYAYYVRGIYDSIIAYSRLYQNQLDFTYGLVGARIGKSFSPFIHSLFSDYPYRLAQMDGDDFAKFMQLRHFAGINVTMPYKRTVIPFCDEVSETALKCNAVNTVVNEKGRLKGYNTDAFGFEYMLSRNGIDVKGKKCLILGSGGSSGTVFHVLEKLGASETVIISRSGENNYENIGLHRDADVIVNTTPVGMSPDLSSSPVDLDLFDHLGAVADIVYTPLRTKLVTDARERGIKAAGGMDMLAAQAYGSYLLFTGDTGNEDLLEKAVRTMERYPENIVLIGMPGAGKTTVGKKLASLLGMDFADTDRHITERTSNTPEELIRKYGEKYFRGVETESVKALAERSHTVISCGGGAVLKEENVRLLRQNGIVIYIERDLDSLSTNGRPLSKSREELRKMYEKRDPVYRAAADHTVTNGDTVSDTVNCIAEILKK